MHEIEYMHKKRKLEFENIFSPLARYPFHQWSVMELGSGTGYQLELLEEIFKEVAGIEIEDSNYKEDRSERIKIYDGINIPFSEDKFDCVFSSNCNPPISRCI